jgi:glycosyltransferase involved in cell wall biosynthesis
VENQIKQGVSARVFYARARGTVLPESDPYYLDRQLCFSNWERAIFHVKEHRILKAFFSLYTRDDFDLTHAYMTFTNGYVSMQVKRKWRIPYVVAVRDTDLNVFFRYMVHLRRLGIEILSEAERIIFLSPAYYEQTLEKYVPPHMWANISSKSVIIPNGIDDFYLRNSSQPRLINENRPLRLMTVGHVCKRKNQITVCKAVELLRKQGLDIEYTVIGQILDKRLFQRISRYAFVNYKPFMAKEQLIDEYRKADVFVMPSITETFGLTYAEAMTQGLPVIYSKNQGFDGQFEEGTVGYRVSSTSQEDVANAILKIRDNYSSISNRCIDLACRFNWENIAEQYNEIYKDCKR